MPQIKVGHLLDGIFWEPQQRLSPGMAGHSNGSERIVF